MKFQWTIEYQPDFSGGQVVILKHRAVRDPKIYAMLFRRDIEFLNDSLPFMFQKSLCV